MALVQQSDGTFEPHREPICKATERYREWLASQVPQATTRKHPRQVCGLDVGQYTPDEIEFMMAVDAYKRDHKRPFPAWSEVLAILISLGYRKG